MGVGDYSNIEEQVPELTQQNPYICQLAHHFVLSVSRGVYKSNSHLRTQQNCSGLGKKNSWEREVLLIVYCSSLRLYLTVVTVSPLKQDCFTAAKDAAERTFASSNLASAGCGK